ncbi:MAG: helix-turn-helix domain-containing protein [Planctomycetota bacterium]
MSSSPLDRPTWLSGERVPGTSNDLSLTQLSERTGMTRQAISRIESGENRNPTMITIVRLA